MKKYKFIKKEEFNGKDYLRIQSVIDIPSIGVKAGDLGGLICADSWLAQDGECWVDQDSIVDSSKIKGNVFIEDSKIVCSCVEGKGIIIRSNILYSNCHDFSSTNSTIHNQTIYPCYYFSNSRLMNKRVLYPKDSAEYYWVIDEDLKNDTFISIPYFNIHKCGKYVDINGDFLIKVKKLKDKSYRNSLVDSFESEYCLNQEEKERLKKILELL